MVQTTLFDEQENAARAGLTPRATYEARSQAEQRRVVGLLVKLGLPCEWGGTNAGFGVVVLQPKGSKAA